MIKYNSAILGYGFTKAIFNNLQHNVEIHEPYKSYLDFSIFLDDFFIKPASFDINKKFHSYFDDKRNQYLGKRILAKNKLKMRYNEMKELGFERWVSKHVFSDTKKVDKEMDTFIYLLYNYWADILWKNIWIKEHIRNKLNSLATDIKSKIHHRNIYTTNYDIFMDDFLKQHHLHGKFKLPLTQFNELLNVIPSNKNEVEYNYLFAAGGIEKKNRLHDIKEMNIPTYDLGFFYEDNLELGDLLIYGLSFASTEYITDNFLNINPQYKNDLELLSIDGHILKRLEEKKNDNKIKSITISYYSDIEEKYLKELFSRSNLYQILKIKHVDEIQLLD